MYMYVYNKNTTHLTAHFTTQVGAGTYGKVYRGVHKRTNFTVAIKALDKARIQEKGMTEKVLFRFPHPFFFPSALDFD